MAGTEADSTGPSKDLTDRSNGNNYDDEEPLQLKYYDMSKARKMIIFNHTYYKEKTYKKRPFGPTTEEDTVNTKSLRNHSEKDVCALKSTFENINFEVNDQNNRNYDEIISMVKALCQEDHTNTSCVCLCVLTHGGKGGKLCAYDDVYPLSELVYLLQNAPGLVGKPKLVIVQACRGGQSDEGIMLVDGPGDAGKRPTHIDTLILLATVEDFKSYRNGHGSWMIQDWCRVVKARHRDLDVLRMTTLVTDLVAKRVSKSLQIENNKKKQTPETLSTLSKLLVFHSTPSREL